MRCDVVWCDDARACLKVLAAAREGAQQRSGSGRRHYPRQGRHGVPQRCVQGQRRPHAPITLGFLLLCYCLWRLLLSSLWGSHHTTYHTTLVSWCVFGFVCFFRLSLFLLLLLMFFRTFVGVLETQNKTKQRAGVDIYAQKNRDGI